MRISTASEARDFAKKLSAFVRDGYLNDALKVLRSILDHRTPFRLLDIIGWEFGKLEEGTLYRLLERISRLKAEGGWVIIAAALHERLETALLPSLEMAQKYIIQADKWYACDTFGERVLGPAILNHFDLSLQHLESWRSHENCWVRRSLGVSVHFWAKRTRSEDAVKEKRIHLLEFLSPMLPDKDRNTARGVGWALKTLGRYNPQLVHDFMYKQIHVKNLKLPAVVIRKALKFLPYELKSNIRSGGK